MPYVVKFLNLVESTKDEFEYSNLLDALKVAKDTNLSGSPHTVIPAMSHKKFDEELLVLLTTCIVYGGPETPQHPEGSYMIMLTYRDDADSEERPVFNALPIPITLNASIAEPEPSSGNVVTVIPIQKKDGN